MDRVLAELGREGAAAQAIDPAQPKRDRLEGACRLVELFAALGRRVPGLHALEVGIQVTDVPRPGRMAIERVRPGANAGVRAPRPVGGIVARLATGAGP